MTAETKDWSEPDEHGTIDVPDELMPLFNKVATQIRFHTISGKSEVLTIAHIVQHAEAYASERTKELEKDRVWVSVKDRLPDFNVSVLVFIPEEDNHVTTGMWDISRKWVLLDEYRVPKSQVTYWRKMIDPPADKSYTPSPERDPEEDTITYKIRTLQKNVFELEAENARLREALTKLFKYMDDGVLVRDISNDHKPDWALRMLRLTADLKEAHSLISESALSSVEENKK